MAEDLPTFAKVREVQLGVGTPAQSHVSVMDLTGRHAPMLQDVWHGQIAFAPMSVANSRAFRAFLASLKGRTGAFRFAVPSYGETLVGTLAEDVSPGATSISVTFSGSTTVKPGHVFRIGIYGTHAAYQIVEALETATGTTVTFEVAPRVRKAQPTGREVSTVNALVDLQLQKDDAQDLGQNQSHAITTLKVVEAI